MGSSGSKSRKTGKRPQHLAKVGGSERNHTSMHDERKGAVDAMGLSGLSKGARTAIITVVALLFIAGVFAFTFVRFV
jgi:hypothetical protein